MVVKRYTLVMLLVAYASQALAQHAEPPVVLGTLAGPDAPEAARSQVYGTDLGWTFVHDGQLMVLFGDSWHDQSSVCSIASAGLPKNDDAQATLPLHMAGRVPLLQFLSPPNAPERFDPIEVLRDGASLHMGLDRTPLTGFSDGERAIAMFHSASFVRCGLAAGAEPTCAAPFECEQDIGVCFPSIFEIPQLCDAKRQLGCGDAQFCVPDGPGYCVDPSSSPRDKAKRVPLEVEWSVPRRDAPTRWESRFTFATNKLYNMTSRTVRSLGEDGVAADYRPGDRTLLVWGRPGFHGNPSLYLMAHDLPLRDTAAGKLDFQPRYFAGLDGRDRPRWSKRQQDAVPLALDGKVDGDPEETVAPVNQMAISWLGEPIHKWVMLYGGGEVTYPWLPPADSTSSAGALWLRFADHPWGPWSPAQMHWATGSPELPNTPLGPGGVLFDPRCVSSAELKCAASDPVRPAHVLFEGCARPSFETDAGHFYAPNIIDAYTEWKPGGALDVYWNVSTWNPYSVLLVRSTFRAP